LLTGIVNKYHMNVVYDSQVFSFQEYGGISRYFFQLIKCFSDMKDVTPELIIKYSNNKHLKEFNSVSTEPFFSSSRFKGRNEIIKFLNRTYTRNNFPERQDQQIFHPTYYHPYFLNLIGDTPFVLTVYDMAHELYPNMFSKFDFTTQNKKRIIPKANRVIAISENTKSDIMRFLQISPTKIDVVPLATDLSIDNSAKPSFSLPENYILYVGKRNTYKNFFFLLHAIQQLTRTYKSLVLICAGGDKFNKEESIEIDKLQLKDRIIQMNVEDAVLAYLYSKARAFVFPSLYEGFGIPILEAFACGCPTILSNRSSLPEIGGNAAKYFNPEDIVNITTALSEVLENNNMADDMRTAGANRVKLFSWKNTAEKTLEIYKKALN
jgi:glycosyltransferase involved in cell wall biosynthesis